MKINRVKYKEIEQVPHLKVKEHFKLNFFGSAPAPFIGRFGYPNVNIGVLSPQFSGDMSSYDSPKLWAQTKEKIGKIASLRAELVNSRSQWNVKEIYSSEISKGKKFMDICREVGMGKQTEVEILLNKAPQLRKQDSEVIPFGPASEIARARITSNTKIDCQVEKVVDDTDLKAAGGLIALYKKGFEENTLSKLLSVGNLGLKKQRKLVPTRWSITATDDTIGKELIKEIKDFSVGDYQIYFGGEWGNYYLILCFPEVWSFELFETYLNKKVNSWSSKGYAYSTDYEGYDGRKKYAEETAGGYYACRISVAEKLKQIKRQNSILALRFITDEYKIPLGVWVCRESARKSMEKGLNFAAEELMLNYARLFIKKKFNFDLELLLPESKLLKQKKAQTKLVKFM
jgi:DNA repair protein NreA